MLCQEWRVRLESMKAWPLFSDYHQEKRKSNFPRCSLHTSNIILENMSDKVRILVYHGGAPLCEVYNMVTYRKREKNIKMIRMFCRHTSFYLLLFPHGLPDNVCIVFWIHVLFLKSSSKKTSLLFCVLKCNSDLHWKCTNCIRFHSS